MRLTRENPKLKKLAVGNFVPLVSRANALAALTARQPASTVIIGEPGIGKTKLLAEARIRAREFRGLYVACIEGCAAPPLDVLIECARGLSSRGLTAQADVDAAAAAPENERLARLREIFECAAGEGPLLLQFDDLQWTDRSTLAALHYCIDRLQDMPIRWHLASRLAAEHVDSLSGDLVRARLAGVHRIDGLTPDELRNLASAVDPALELSAHALAELFRQTAGNPLYAESLLLTRDPGAAPQPVPPTLRTALGVRLNRLSSEAATAGAWIAVANKPLSESTVVGLSGMSPGAARAAFCELEDAAIIDRTPPGAGFRHDLLRRVCYDGLGDCSRTKIHRALADASGDLWERAIHFDGATQYDKAADIFLEIGWDRLERDAPEEARESFQRALDRAVRHTARYWEASAGVACAFAALSRHFEAEEAMREFEKHAALVPKAVRVKARYAHARAVWDVAEDTGALAGLLEHAIAEASDTNSELMPSLLCLAGALHERRGDLQLAKQALERGIALAIHAPADRDRIRLGSWLGVVESRLGNARAGAKLVEAAADRAAANRFGNELAQCCAKLCYIYDMLDDPVKYEAACRRGLDAPDPKTKRVETLLTINLACVALDAGRVQEALGLAIAAAAAAELTYPSIYCQAMCAQAIAYAILGDGQSARFAVAAALTPALPPSWRRAVEFTRARVAELDERFDEALDGYSRIVEAAVIQRAGEVFDARARAGLVRSACAISDKRAAAHALESLAKLDRHGWPVTRALHDEAAGCYALSWGDVGHGCEALGRASRATPDAFARANMQVAIAYARRDREMFVEAIDALERMGATRAADGARRLARLHGLRPGRKRRQARGLSENELRVARLIAAGRTNAEIATHLSISQKSVEYHITKMLTKFDLRSRVEIASRITAGTLMGAEPSRPASK